MSTAEKIVRINAGVSKCLLVALAETTIATLKSQNYHWNVTGPMFGSLHALFQEIYEDHFEAQDLLAERLRAQGEHVDGRYSEFLKVSAIHECPGKIPALKMLSNLADDQRMLSDSLKKLAKVADEIGDVVTSDMAIQRAGIHNKFEWMLRAHLQN